MIPQMWQIFPCRQLFPSILSAPKHGLKHWNEEIWFEKRFELSDFAKQINIE